MADNAQVKLERWLRDQLLRERDTGRVVRLELRHLPVGTKAGQEVHTIALKGEPAAGSDWFESTASEILRVARNDADGMAAGLQRYQVTVYRLEDPDRARERHLFVMVAPDAEDTSGGFESEPADKRGVTSQLMRHLEQTQKTFMGSMGVVLQSMQKMAATLADENEQLRAARIESMDAVEELLSQKHMRDLEAEKAHTRNELLREAAASVKMLAPAIMGRLSSGSAGAPAARDAQIKSLQESLTPEQQTKIAEALSPAQQIALLELFQQANQ